MDLLLKSEFFTLFVFIISLNIASFLNLVAFRLPFLLHLIEKPASYKGRLNIIYNPSFCPKCLYKIDFISLIPIFGYLIRFGKCKNCKAPIGLDQFFGELFFSISSTILWIFVKDIDIFIYLWLLFSLFYVNSVIDFKHKYLPDIITFLLLLVAAIYQIYSKANIIDSIIGMIIGFLFFWCLGFIVSFLKKKEALGFGDIKLFAVAGFLVGYQNIIFVSFIASLFGLFYILLRYLFSIIQNFTKLKKKEINNKINENIDEIAFGPMISCATFLFLVFKFI